MPSQPFVTATAGAWTKVCDAGLVEMQFSGDETVYIYYGAQNDANFDDAEYYEPGSVRAVEADSEVWCSVEDGRDDSEIKVYWRAA